MLTKLTKTELEIIHGNNGLYRYLKSLLEDVPHTQRSWLYEQVPKGDDVLSHWLSHLDVLKNGSNFEQEVFQFDISQMKKWGPQGGHPPISELMDLVQAGYDSSPYPSAFKTQEWLAAKSAVVTSFKRAGIYALRPASYSRVIDDMQTRDTLESNSGWPLFTRRNKPEVKEHAIRSAEDGSWLEYPAIALFRNYNQKIRLVWMYPMATNLVEGSFFQPLQSRIMKSELANTFYAPWKGFEQVRSLITELYSDPHRFCAASDFSATDEHFKMAASLEVFDVIKWCFQPQFWASLKLSLKHMHHIPLVISPTQKLVGEHGVSSGSNWTNFVETVFDSILSEYVRIKESEAKGSGTEGYSGLYAIGDDMSWQSGEYDAKFSDRLEQYGREVGQVIKSDKTTNDRDRVKSLQRLFQRGYSNPEGKIRAVYSTVRALKSSVYPERFHDPRRWSSDMFCARQYMILENCVDHPLFEEFVKFIVAGNDHLIPFAKLSRSKLDAITRESKLLPGLNPTYNQERRDQSLADFASIRIAAKL